jgi:cobalt/nickel transport system ATP-binding protein
MDCLTTPLLQLHNVSFRYHTQTTWLLNNINFQLYAGEKVGLIGANGSGKSTLLQLLMGLQFPSAGEIKIAGQICRCEADFVKIRGHFIGLLFQDAEDQLFCPTVAEDIAFGPLNQGKSPAEVQRIIDNLLNSLNLTHYASRFTYQLSGGEKRLIALATVLAMQPPILLLDEPTTGLDEEFTQQIHQLLQNLPQTMLIISHDHNLLTQLTHRQLRLEKGQLIVNGK